MEEQAATQGTAPRRDAPPGAYTLGEAAGYLAVREDDLNALLPDTSLAVETRLTLTFTTTDVELLERFIQGIRKYGTESVYGGGDL